MDQFDVKKRFINGLLLGYLVFIFILLLYCLILGYQWINQPFLGKFLEPSLLVSPLSTNPIQQDNSSSKIENLTGSQLTEINNQKILKKNTYNQLLNNYKPGDSVDLTFESESGIIMQPNVTLEQFPFLTAIKNFFGSYILGWIFFALALIAYKDQLNSGHQSGLIFFSGAMAIVFGSLFDIISTHIVFPIWIAAVPVAAAGFFHFALEQNQPFRFRNQIIGFGYLSAFTISFITWIKPFGLIFPILFFDYIKLILIISMLFFVIAFLVLIYSALNSIDPIEKKLRILLSLGSITSFVVLIIWIVFNIFNLNIPFSYWIIFPIIIFPVLFWILRFQIATPEQGQLGNVVLRNSVLAILVTLGYGFIVSGAGLILFGKLKIDNPFILGFIFFIISICIFPIKTYLDKKIHAGIGSFSDNYKNRLHDFRSDLKKLVKLDDVVNLLRLDIQEAVQAQYVHIFLFDSNSNFYRATYFGNQRSSDLVFDLESGLVKYLVKETKGLYLREKGIIPLILKPDLERIQLLGVNLFIPIQGQKQLLGWVAMSNRLDGESFSINEINYLNSVVEQSSLAIERSLVIDSLERRNIESGVLAKVAQGVNYTVELNDIYELIYTQISQIFNPDQFAIVLKHLDGNSLIQVFYVENSERLNSKENIKIESINSFEARTITQGRVFYATDYLQDCAENADTFIRENLGSAIFIPLNAGAETIGLIFLGQYTNQIHLSFDQISLLQALADQIAGAITKAKILQESERRALQLSKLNNLTQKLTATLSLQPLIQEILNISLEIINCEKGAIYLVDSVTKELIPQISLGYQSATENNPDLEMKAMQLENVIQKGVAEIINPGFTSSDSDKIYSSSVESRNAYLMVPLQSKGVAIGVIELINKKDGLPFNINDQDILTAFAAQASISIDNAKLYSSTDQALTNKVEELSIMQRIDRELNISLDLQRVLDITLHWAIRQSQASAGFIGLILQENIRIDIYEGYQQKDLEKFLNDSLPITFLDLDVVLAGGQPKQKKITNGDIHFLENAKTQILIPIKRKDIALAFLFLEFIDDASVDDQVIDFLIRLSDHASIALVNGQLYTEVRSANLAKSEFVSLVAHELKNPMTSIKGYTDLLSARAVGEINDAQANFLSTISSNVDRMNTLVSDLNDLTKIEAGRLRLEFKSINLIEIIEEVIRSNKRFLDDKQQTIEVSIADTLPPVWVDPTRLSQILINLINNANKYSEKGTEILIGAVVEEVTQPDLSLQNFVHLWVKDAGIGMKPEDQKKVFQKFFRSEDPKAREVSGTGLGLNITKSMVELQGGTIWFESEFRKGSIFHLHIPIYTEKN